VSAPTDLGLLGRYTGGEITYNEYAAEMKKRTDDRDDAQVVRQLVTHYETSVARGYTSCNNPEQAAQLVASELALKSESRRRRQERAARQAEEQRRRAREAAYVKAQQREIDVARSTASTCTSSGQALIRELEAKQTQLEKDKQAVGLSKYGRTMLERTRREIEQTPIDWQSLPAEQQGFAIATEMAARRAAIAEVLGDEIQDTRPAYQVAPITIGGVLPEYTEAYKAASLPSLDQVLEDGPPTAPVIDVGLWPGVGSGEPYTVDVIGGGSGGGVCYSGQAPSTTDEEPVARQTIPPDWWLEMYDPTTGKPLDTTEEPVARQTIPPDWWLEMYDPTTGKPLDKTGGGDGPVTEPKWIDRFEGVLRALDEGFVVQVGPGLSDVTVGKRIAGSGVGELPGWVWLALIGGGVLLLVILMK